MVALHNHTLNTSSLRFDAWLPTQKLTPSRPSNATSQNSNSTLTSLSCPKRLSPNTLPTRHQTSPSNDTPPTTWPHPSDIHRRPSRSSTNPNITQMSFPQSHNSTDSWAQHTNLPIILVFLLAHHHPPGLACREHILRPRWTVRRSRRRASSALSPRSRQATGCSVTVASAATARSLYTRRATHRGADLHCVCFACAAISTA